MLPAPRYPADQQVVPPPHPERRDVRQGDVHAVADNREKGREPQAMRLEPLTDVDGGHDGDEPKRRPRETAPGDGHRASTVRGDGDRDASVGQLAQRTSERQPPESQAANQDSLGHIDDPLEERRHDQNRQEFGEAWRARPAAQRPAQHHRDTQGRNAGCKKPAGRMKGFGP